MSRLGRAIAGMLRPGRRPAHAARGGGDGRRDDGADGGARDHDLVEPGPRSPRAELAVAALLLLAAAAAIGFIVVYALPKFPAQHELLGTTLAISFAFVAAALIVLSRRVLPTEELEEAYPEDEHPDAQLEVAKMVEESGSGITRKGLLAAAGGTAGGALGLAALTPALSLGPWFDVTPLRRTPWRAGRRLVDDKGKPLKAEEIEHETFYTAFPEGASHRNIGAMLVLVKMDPKALRLPPERRAWAPEGIMAFSKVCTHAGCAISLFRKPTYGPTQPAPALVCPCHYSTFDPARGGEVIFGPAGRPLPQLPLHVDAKGELRAAGNFSDAIGPSWWGVNLEKPS